MTKADIVERIYQNHGFSKKESVDLVETLFDIIKKSLKDGDTVKISGFGNFVIRQKHPRQGRNPHTNEGIEISARKVLTFRPSQLLKEAINTPVEAAEATENN